MSANAVEFTYLISADPAYCTRIRTTPLAAAYAAEGDQATCRALLSETTLWIERDGPHKRRLGYDLATGARLLLDPEHKQYSMERRGIPARDLVRHRNPALVVAQRFVDRPYAVGPDRGSLSRFDVEHPDETLEAWAFTDRTASALPNALLWALLIPGLPPDTCAKAGLPGDLLIRDPKRPEHIVYRLRLTAMAPVADVPEVGPEVVPKGWRDATAKTPSRPGPERAAEGRPADAAAERLRQAVARGRVLERDVARARHVLRASGQDVAWVVGQPALDTITTIGNTFVGGLGTLRGESSATESAHIDIDWWPTLEPRLDPQVLDCLRMASLAYVVSEGGTPVGLRGPEIADYTMHVLGGFLPGIQALYGDATARLFNFFAGPTFTAMRRQELADAQFAALTKPYRLDLGFSELGSPLADFIVVTASNFDFDVHVDGDPVIGSLTFVEEAIRLVLRVNRIHAGFDFETHADDSVGSFFCGLLTFGICTALQSNQGVGEFSCTNPGLVVDVTTSMDYEGVVSLQAALNRDATVFDTSVWVFGANLIQDVFDLFASWWESSADGLNSYIFNAIDKSVNDFLDLSFFDWPSLWHATGGPPIAGTSAQFASGAGVWEADVASTAGLFGGVSAEVDPSRADPLAYVLSKRFLTAWARELVWFDHAETDFGNIFGLLGVDLPDASTVDARPLPPKDRDPFGVGAARQGALAGCEPPPTLPPAYANKLRLTRSAPQVVFPGEGANRTPGHLEVRYELDLSATRTELVSYSRVIPHGECVDLRAPRGQGDGWKPGARVPGGITAGVSAAIGRVQRGGVPQGVSPTTLAGRARQIEAMRDAARLTDPGEGDIVVPGRPGRVGDPGAPGGIPPVPGAPTPPQGSSRPGLPDTVCEPPHCEWFTYVHDDPFLNYLHASVVVTCDLRLGFNTNGAMWIPELQLALADNGATMNPMPVVTVERIDLTVAGPFDHVPRDTITTWATDICTRDANAMLLPGVRSDAPALDRQLVPDLFATYVCPQPVLSNPCLVLDLVHYRQSGGGATPAYTVVGDLLYWPVEIDEHITSLFH